MQCRHAAALGLLFVAAALADNAVAAASVRAYALSAAGESILGNGFACATFGPDPRTGYFSGIVQVSLPDAGCGVGVDSRSASAASGGVTVASNLPVGFGTPSEPRAFIGSSRGRAGFGNLGVRASASYHGSADAFTVLGAQAFGMQTEPMTFGGATGAGFYRPTFTVDGSMFNVGRTDNEVDFFYSIDAGPVFLGFRIKNSRDSVDYFEAGSGSVPSLPGMTVTGDRATGLTISGSTTFTLSIPIVFGKTTDLTFAAWAGIVPSSSVGLLTPSAGETEFSSTFKLTGITVTDASGTPLDTFSITSGSGTLYDRNGVVNVPEPAAYASLLFGLLGLAVFRGSRRNRLPHV